LHLNPGPSDDSLQADENLDAPILGCSTPSFVTTLVAHRVLSDATNGIIQVPDITLQLA
jgi:hypothetical protein